LKPFVAFFVCFSLIATAASALAGPRLKPLMRQWKSEVARAEPMLAGAAPYDEAELRRVMNGFVADTQEIEAGLAGHSAEAAAFKGRFAQFRADAADVLASLASREAARGKFARLRRECAGCHDVFAN
jgi:cytochrome c556